MRVLQTAVAVFSIIGRMHSSNKEMSGKRTSAIFLQLSLPCQGDSAGNGKKNAPNKYVRRDQKQLNLSHFKVVPAEPGADVDQQKPGY